MSETRAQFPMSMDRKFTLFTWGVVLFQTSIFVGLGVVFWSLSSLPPYVFYVHCAIAALVLGIMPFVYFATPRSLSLTETSLNIHTAMGRAREMPLHDIAGVRVETLSRIIRTMGVGGMFGAWGEMKSEELPQFEGYITRSNKHVILERTNDKPLVLTPDDPEAFAQALQQQLN